MKRLVASFALTLVYSLTWFIAVLAAALRWPWIRRRRPHRRIIVNGTFHNPNWFRAHITPLVEGGYGDVALVCDEPVDELPGLTYRCPPMWAARLFSRAGAKALWTLWEGIVRPADVYVGYHIFPSATTVLVCARLLGGRAVYQVTSGPLELEGGGWNAENAVLVALGGPSKWIERLAMAVVRQVDVAVVRGESAGEFVRNHGFRRQLEIVTGSVRTEPAPEVAKDIDVIFVGRLTEYKRPDRLIDVVAKVAAEKPDLKVAIVGDGPDRDVLEARCRELGLTSAVEFLGQRRDVMELLARSRLFVLTSRWEGVSIAMLEAMAMRAVPVVNDVGDLRDFARDGETGYVVEPDDIETHAARILELLGDEARLSLMADRARELVVERCDSDVLAARWCGIFESLASKGPTRLA